MKQSLGLVLLQIFGVIVSFVSIFWIAGSLPPEVYAIIGVYGIISTLVVVFSNTGLEMFAIRNILSWIENGEDKEIKILITQSVILRIFASIIVMVPVILYSKYISIAKFDGQYFSLFIMMSFLSIGKAANDSMILILRAFNRYLSASFISYSVNSFGRLAALFIYIKFGFTSYIYTILTIPIVITIPVIYMLKDWIVFKNVFSVERLKNNLMRSKEFALSSYISYGFNQTDQLLVSIFLKPEILGTFTLVKSMANMGKIFIENIFDPLIQELVKYKEDLKTWNKKLNRIQKLQSWLLIISLVVSPALYYNLDFLIHTLGISDYIHIKSFIILAYLSQVSYLAIKLKTTIISIFYAEKFFLRITLFRSTVSIILFLIIISIVSKYLFMHILIMNLLLFFYVIKITRNNNPVHL